MTPAFRHEVDLSSLCQVTDGDYPRTRRYPCDFCAEPDAWPDRCSEAFGEAQGKLCDVLIPAACLQGDHRRCSSARCPVAASWHPVVQRAGVRAAREAVTLWAVVSIAGGWLRVLGTEDHMCRARRMARGDGEVTRLVYLVRVSDGELF